jgi:hypothetical protein
MVANIGLHERMTRLSVTTRPTGAHSKAILSNSARVLMVAYFYDIAPAAPACR